MMKLFSPPEEGDKSSGLFRTELQKGEARWSQPLVSLLRLTRLLSSALVLADKERQQTGGRH